MRDRRRRITRRCSPRHGGQTLTETSRDENPIPAQEVAPMPNRTTLGVMMLGVSMLAAAPSAHSATVTIPVLTGVWNSHIHHAWASSTSSSPVSRGSSGTRAILTRTGAITKFDRLKPSRSCSIARWCLRPTQTLPDRAAVLHAGPDRQRATSRNRVHGSWQSRAGHLGSADEPGRTKGIWPSRSEVSNRFLSSCPRPTSAGSGRRTTRPAMWIGRRRRSCRCPV